MNHFNCPHDPLTCEHSVFLKITDESGVVKRWVECADYHYAEDPKTKKMRWFEKESFKLVVHGTEVEVKKGDLCVNNRSDWLGKI
jgi:hypothetical protein